MIWVVPRDNMYCPVAVCDYCNEEITDAADGNYEFRMFSADYMDTHPDRPFLGDMCWFTHKRCTDALRGEILDSDDFVWGSMELRFLPVYFARNTKIDLKESERMVDSFAGV